MAESTTASTSTTGGLSSTQAAARLQKYGPNALEEKKVSPLLQLLGYFWGPIPWMIEIAAVLSALLRHWADFWIIIALLIFNAAVGFWQEFTAGNAVEALKRQLALKARALRDGKWQEIDARTLVPGDVIRIRLGDVIPADVKQIEGDYLSVDQSALTGESLPEIALIRVIPSPRPTSPTWSRWPYIAIWSTAIRVTSALSRRSRPASFTAVCERPEIGRW